jgi:hypothetical protein
VKAEEIDEKMKAVLSFEGTKKSMVLNRTNAEALKLMFGRETDAWLGKRVTIFPATMKDPFSGDENATTTAIRVRGSPDITAPQSATIQRGRKAIRVSVVPTGKAAAAKAHPPPRPPVVDVLTGETEDAALERTHTRDPFAGNGLDNGHGLNGSGL